MCDLILSFYLGLVGLLLIAILIYIYVELVESYDDLNLIVKKIKYKRGEIVERPNKYDFDFSEDYESNLETYCDELEKALDKACEELEELDKCHSYEINKQIVEKKSSSTITFGYQNKEEWKEWCMKDE